MKERIVSKCKKPPGILLTFFFLTCSVYSLGLTAYRLFEGKWPESLIAFALAIVMGTFTYLMYRFRRSLLLYELVIDLKEEIVEFHNFPFVSDFRLILPEPPRKKELIPFEDVIDLKLTHERGSTDAYALRTTKGRVKIPDCMQDLTEILDIFRMIVDQNSLDRDRFSSTLDHEPKLRLPLYAWIIIVIGIISFVVFVYLKVSKW